MQYPKLPVYPIMYMTKLVTIVFYVDKNLIESHVRTLRDGGTIIKVRNSQYRSFKCENKLKQNG